MRKYLAVFLMLFAVQSYADLAVDLAAVILTTDQAVANSIANDGLIL